MTQDLYNKIAKEIESDSSPVGIDAKKIRVIVIDKLLKIEDLLNKIKNKVK